MGDRGNIVVIEERQGINRPIFLYTHWRGADLPDILADALIAGKIHGRWEDPAYFTRIIFEIMTAGAEGYLGFGISPFLQDNEHPLLVVEFTKPEPRIYLAREPKTAGEPILQAGSAWTFQGFLDLKGRVPGFSGEDRVDFRHFRVR